MNQDNSFQYTYSAPKNEEVQRIREKYLPKEEDKMEQLRKLHAIPTQKAQAASLAIGIIGALILGLGMSLCMTDLGASLGIFAKILGIIIGLVGAVPVALAYPVYNRIIIKEREKIAPEILRLSDELLK